MEHSTSNILANTIAPDFVDTMMSVKAAGKKELENEWFKDNCARYDPWC
ncbi:MAG: hypothetical protein ABIN01_25230 [Ferruginibacter sp.]